MAEASMASPDAQSPEPQPFRTQVLVRFADCDPAGIVFYPKFLVMFNNLVEDWCRDGLGFSFDEIVVQRGWGLPTVHLEVNFIAPSRLGEVLTASLYVRNIGTSSIGADISLSGPDSVDRVRGKVVLVLTDRSNHKSFPIPDDLRAKIARFLIPA
ncbi:MAG TPA: thioesterase family protein [Candidatus Acidoferrales bacterium]|jgi:4-hydroxybenzoyl-CoA thioesterase|nr:thioesterase family protein [Candidatus Acidoferrales bacterium]